MASTVRCNVNNTNIIFFKFDSTPEITFCYSIQEFIDVINNLPLTKTVELFNMDVELNKLIKILKDKCNTFVIKNSVPVPITREQFPLLQFTQLIQADNPTLFTFCPNFPENTRFWNNITDKIVVVPEKINLVNLQKIIDNEEKIVEIYERNQKTFTMKKYHNIRQNVNLVTGMNYVWYSYTTNSESLFQGRLKAQNGGYQGMHKNMRKYLGYFDYYYDLDMVNCWPNLAIQWLAKNDDITRYPVLSRYVSHRQEMFDLLAQPPNIVETPRGMKNIGGISATRNIAKYIILRIFNGGNVKNNMTIPSFFFSGSLAQDYHIDYPPTLLFDLYYECLRAHGLVIKMYPEWLRESIMSQKPADMDYETAFHSSNKGGTSWFLLKARRQAWTKLMNLLENRTLFTICQVLYSLGFKPRSLIFDGLGVEKDPRLTTQMIERISRLVYQKIGYKIAFELKDPPEELEGLEQIFMEQVALEEAENLLENDIAPVQ